VYGILLGICKKIVDAVQDDHFMVSLITAAIQPGDTFFDETGAAGYHFGNAVDMTAILPQCRRQLVFGNIDPAGHSRTVLLRTSWRNP
jgi:uroporphyrinogen decarboxylase